MKDAYEREESPAAKDAMAQILINSRLCAEGHRPICQDTGMVVVFLKIGMEVQLGREPCPSTTWSTRACAGPTPIPDNPLRASVLADPAGARKNTRDNTPAVIYMELVPGNTVDVKLAAKGGGSENKAHFTVLNPSDSIVDWVLSVLPEMGAGWCPPGILGIGVGGTPEKALLLAKEALLDPIDIQDLKARGPSNRIEELRLELLDKVNALGIGAQGLGGLTTVLDVKIKDYPTHAASLPVGLIPNCAATRHIHFTLDGSGPASFTPPALSEWPEVAWNGPATARRVNLDTLTPADTATWKAGEQLLLSGKLLTGRDAAHKKLADLIKNGQPLPVDFRNRFIYYVGPVDPIARRGRRPRRPHHRHPHGQVHRPDAGGPGWPHRHGGQVGTGTGGHRLHQGPRRRLLHRRGRRRLPGGQGHQGGEGAGLPGTGHGGDLRVRRGGHAGDRGGGQPPAIRCTTAGPREWRMKIGKIPLATH